MGFYLRDLSRKYVVKFLEDFQSLRGSFLGSFAISFKIGKNVESSTNKVLIIYSPGLFSARKKGLPCESAVRFLYTYVQTRSGGQHVSPLSHLTPQSLPCRLSFPLMNLFALAVLIVI